MANPTEQPRAPRAPRNPIAENAPWKPPHWELADATALKQLAAGTASPEMQKRALDFIMLQLCGLHDWPYRPGDSDRDTNIALGRQYVAHQIAKLLRVDLSKVRRD